MEKLRERVLKMNKDEDINPLYAQQPYWSMPFIDEDGKDKVHVFNTREDLKKAIFIESDFQKDLKIKALQDEIDRLNGLLKL